MPGYIYPVTPRKEPNMSYQIFRLLHRPLAILMTSLHQSKVAIRTNIAFVYLFFGISQIIVLMIFKLKSFDSSYFIFPVIALLLSSRINSMDIL